MPIAHKLHRCTRENCNVCSGGLALCTVCGGGEGALLTYCAGYRLSSQTLDDIYEGQRVVDLTTYRARRQLGWEGR